MTSALIFLLFILNAILIFAVVLLYMRQNRLLELEKTQKKMQAETEELITSFLLEIKEENEFFISKLDDLRNKQENENDIPSEMDKKEVASKEKEHNKQQPMVETNTYARMQAEKAYQPIPSEPFDIEDEEKTDDLNELFADQVHSLHAEGLSSEEIAQRLNKGKTEVNLALKFKNMRS